MTHGAMHPLHHWKMTQRTLRRARTRAIAMRSIFRSYGIETLNMPVALDRLGRSGLTPYR